MTETAEEGTDNMNYGYYNGTYAPLDTLTAPVTDRAFYFGDGVYDAGPCRNYQFSLHSYCSST